MNQNYSNLECQALTISGLMPSSPGQICLQAATTQDAQGEFYKKCDYDLDAPYI